MTYAFLLTGTLDVQPPAASFSPSGDFNFHAQLEESLSLTLKHVTTVSLTSDSALSVSLGDLPSAHVLFLRLQSGTGPVLAQITTSAGASQIVPVDPFFLLIASGAPVTAFTLQRAPGIATVVEVLLGYVGP